MAGAEPPSSHGQVQQRLRLDATTANALALLCWLPLILAPRSRLSTRLTATPLLPLGFALVYVVLVGVMLAVPGTGGMDSLASLREGFSRDAVLLLAWVHYLSFDMFVGFWELRDSRRLDLSPWLVAPCLVLTLMLGPSGLLAYCLLRRILRGSVAFTLPPSAGA